MMSHAQKLRQRWANSKKSLSYEDSPSLPGSLDVDFKTERVGRQLIGQGSDVSLLSNEFITKENIRTTKRKEGKPSQFVNSSKDGSDAFSSEDTTVESLPSCDLDTGASPLYESLSYSLLGDVQPYIIPTRLQNSILPEKCEDFRKQTKEVEISKKAPESPFRRFSFRRLSRKDSKRKSLLFSRSTASQPSSCNQSPTKQPISFNQSPTKQQNGGKCGCLNLRKRLSFSEENKRFLKLNEELPYDEKQPLLLRSPPKRREHPKLRQTSSDNSAYMKCKQCHYYDCPDCEVQPEPRMTNDRNILAKIYSDDKQPLLVSYESDSPIPGPTMSSLAISDSQNEDVHASMLSITSYDKDELRSKVDELPSKSSRRSSRSEFFNGLYESITTTNKLRLVHQLSLDDSRSHVYTELATLTPAYTLGKVPPIPYLADFSYFLNAESRRQDFRNKGTKSAPTSFECNAQAHSSMCPISLCLDSALKPATTLFPWMLNDGLVRGRDGGRNGAGYMNLPSPNVHNEDSDHHDIFKKEGSVGDRKGSDSGDHASDSENGEEQGVPASALNRRKALVPPKVFTDNAPFDDQEHETARSINGSGPEGGVIRNKRRSSIVVIPPMQICPGDLLVYSKVLTHKTNLICNAGDLDGSTQSLSFSDADAVGNRKGRNKWSLMQLFDRGHRGKSESLTGLEEVLNCLQPSEFVDEQLSRYKGMCWADFVAYKDGKLQKLSEKDNTLIIKEHVRSSSPSSTEGLKEILRGVKEREGSKDPTGFLGLGISPTSGTGGICWDKTERSSAAENEDTLSSLRHYPSAANDRTVVEKKPGSAIQPVEKNVEKEKPVESTGHTPVSKKRRPLMRAKTELSIARSKGSSSIFSILSEKMLPADRSPVKSVINESKPLEEEETNHKPEEEPSRTSPLTLDEALIGVDKSLEDAFDSVQAAFQKNEIKRREAVWDLFQSECAFLYDHLMVLKNVYMEPLKKIQVDGFAMFAEPELLFGNLDELCCVTYGFCKEFINLLEQHLAPGGNLDTTKVLVKLFQKGSKATMLCQAYHRYALNYINALNYLETLRRQLEFIEFEKWCNRDPRCKKLQLTDLLVAPVQHIMKVPLILRDIETRTEEPQERACVREIIEAEELSLRELDDKMKWLKNFERLLEIQRNIFWPPVTELDPKIYIPDFLKVMGNVPDFVKNAISKQPCERLIVSPRRQIILEGTLHLVDHSKPQEMYVILFDDMLLITRRKKGLHKKKSSLTENWASSCSRSQSSESSMRYIVYRQPLSLDRFFLHDVTPQDMSTNKLEAAFVIVNLNRFQQIVAVYTFQAQSEQNKHNWLLRLKETQEKWKVTLQNTVFRNQHRLSVPTSSPPKPHPLDPRSFT